MFTQVVSERTELTGHRRGSLKTHMQYTCMQGLKNVSVSVLNVSVLVSDPKSKVSVSSRSRSARSRLHTCYNVIKPFGGRGSAPLLGLRPGPSERAYSVPEPLAGGTGCPLRPRTSQQIALHCVSNKMLSYRRETALQGALQFSPKVENWNWETIFYGHYRSIFNHCDIIGLKICGIPWKKTQNKGYYGVQGHSRSSRSVPIESPYAISY